MARRFLRVRLVVALVLGASLLFAGAREAGAELPAPDAGFGLVDRSILQAHQGDLRVRVDGTVVENLEIRGSLRIIANDVVVRNVWVYGEEPWTVLVEKGSATFEHVEIGHPEFIGERGIGGDNVTARYLEIHHVEDGIKAGTNSTYEYVWVHSLDSRSDDPHADALQDDGGITNFVIRNSILDATGPLGHGNAAVLIKTDLGPTDGIRVESSFLNGGAYTVYVRDGGFGDPRGVVFRDNYLGGDFQFGRVDAPGPVTWLGNRDYATGAEVRADGTEGDPVDGHTPPPLPEPVHVTTTTTTVPGSPTTTAAGAGQDGSNGIVLAVVLGIAGFLLGIMVMRLQGGGRLPGRHTRG